MNRALAHQKLDEIGELEDGWDGYSAFPVRRDSLDMARRFIDILPQGVPQPSIVPVPGSWVQVEWHVGGFDIEIEWMPMDGCLTALVDVELPDGSRHWWDVQGDLASLVTLVAGALNQWDVPCE